MSKHTPGPWTVQPFGVVKLIQTLDYKTIAKVSADSVADARLIAAAPDLLAVLLKYEHDGHLQSFEDRERFRADARAAISKATGEINV